MATRTRFPADRGLTARMITTVFLLGLLYALFVTVLFLVGVKLVFILVIAFGLLFVQYFYSDRIALYSMGGKIVTREQAPKLHGVVDRLCAMADMPKPRWRSPMSTCRTPLRPVVTRNTPSSASRRASCDDSTSPSSKPCWPTSCPTSLTATSPS